MICKRNFMDLGNSLYNNFDVILQYILTIILSGIIANIYVIKTHIY